MRMITLQDFMEVVKYRITEGSDHTWNCYGPNAFILDSWNGDQNGYSISVVFDTLKQTVYELSAHDYQRNRAYRWIHPDFLSIHRDEAQGRGLEASQAWDDINYIDLELAEDILAKTSAIVDLQDYDTRVSVPVDLNENELFQLMLRAHEQDITLNKLVENILIQQINQKGIINHDLNC